MKHLSDTGKAEVKDFSNGKDGSTSVDVNYSYDYDELETAAELAEHFSTSDLIKLANARLKSTENSGARQKAIAPYAQDPNSTGAVHDRMVKDAMKLGMSQSDAETYIDSIFAAIPKKP